MQNKQLTLVKDQAQREQDKLAQKFEQAVTFVQNENKQLLQLREYEKDYLAKINEQQSHWSADQAGRYRHFCHQLAKAIVEQEHKVVNAERRLEIMRAELCRHQQKINVLNDVIARDAAENAHLHNMVMQKEMDEFAGRRFQPLV